MSEPKKFTEQPIATAKKFYGYLLFLLLVSGAIFFYVTNYRYDRQKEAEVKREKEQAQQRQHENDSLHSDPVWLAEAHKRKADSSSKVEHTHQIWGIAAKCQCSYEDAERVFNGEIWVGMNYKMLVVERGDPDRIHESDYGNGKEYQACWDGYPASCFYCGPDGVVKSYN